MAESNPFRLRHSDTHGAHSQFAKTFAPEIFTVLPPPPWRELLVLRSAPGAGKTSLMRSMTAENLHYLHEHRTRTPVLHSAFTSFGALGPNGPTVLGVKVNLDRDFIGLADVSSDERLQTRLLFRLLDSRIMAAVVRSALVLANASTEETHRVRIEAGGDHPLAAEALRRLGGSNGQEISSQAELAEREVLDLLDRLVLRGDEEPSGHQRLYSLEALSEARFWVDEDELPVRPLIMLDDGHALSPRQRERVLEQLGTRQSSLGRWFAVRSKALSDDDLVGAGDVGRDYMIIELEALERERTAAGAAAPKYAGQKMTAHRYRKMLLDIADKRADRAVERLVDEGRTFTSFFDVDPDDALGEREAQVLDAIRNRLRTRAKGSLRYEEWLSQVERLSGRDGMARLAELEVLILRDQRRAQQDLFADILPLAEDEISARGSSSLREAAALAVSHEFGVPYYFGSDCIARLASANVEQFLDLCGDLMSYLQIQSASNRPVALTPKSQDRLLNQASRKYFDELSLLPDGDLVQVFVERVGDIARAEASKPTIPYPPGVTGTAISMSDRRKLRDRDFRQSTPGGEALWRALLSAIAHNVVWIELDYSVKNDRWMVIYLNRLLCPRYEMPLTLGGFRERPVRSMASWFADTPYSQEELS